MKIVTIPIPPNADEPQYRNPLAFNRAASDWMKRVKGILEGASQINDTPVNQPFVVSSFTTNTALNGTSTLGDVANYVCSLTSALTKKGILTPN